MARTATGSPPGTRRAAPRTSSNGNGSAGRARNGSAGSSPSRTASQAAKRGAKAAAKGGAKAAAKGTAKALTPGGGGVAAGARHALAEAARAAARRTLRSGAQALREAVERSADAGHRAYEAGLSRRLPIQVSIDVAVPVAVAWDEWMRLQSITEGVDRIEQVERDGDLLFGRVAGARGRDWEAEVLDERERQSFAWRSVQGSDCAGLVTFHELSERLTRVELDLDVLPTGPVQALAFASHLAHRRAEAELRRFKAQLEFINPDEYAEQVSEDGEPAGEDEAGEPTTENE